MAIGFGYQAIGRALKPQETGIPDYVGALSKGLEAGFKPASLSQKLLSDMLTNKMNESKARHAEEITLADLAHTQAGTQGLNDEHSMRGLRQQLLQQKVSEGDLRQNFYNKVLDGMNGEVNNGGDNISTVNPYYASALKHLTGIDLYAQSPQQKSDTQLDLARRKQESSLNLKRAQQLQDTAKDLELAGMDISGIHDILSGDDALHTGIVKSLVGKFGHGSEKLGELNERALRLQAQMTKALSSRGGVGAANIVASGKPSSWKSTSENLGISRAYAERIKNEFNLLNKEYKQITGKELPYSLPEYVKNINKKINKHSFKPRTSFNDSADYHNYMKSLTGAQQKIVIEAIGG